MGYIKDALDYLGAQIFNISKGDKTAHGETDDKQPPEQSQVKLEGAGSTDARSIANVAFSTSGIIIPAEVIAAGDVYDVTQARTRINKMYGTTREQFYRQASSDAAARKSRLAKKQALTMECYKISSDSKAMFNANVG